MLRAVNFVNSIKSDINLETAATIIDIIQNNPCITRDQLLNRFYKYPKENPARINENMINNMLNDLICSKIIIYSLFGQYEINTEYIKKAKMPSFKSRQL